MAKTTKSFLALLRGGNLGVPLVILCILAMVILPLPPALLDILFTFNIVLAVMGSIYQYIHVAFQGSFACITVG
ncbi:hypothetical protein ACEPQY_24620, partial [Escherichia coli]|uniref:hypothetical protein n=1 Tax=Escherichia coli TaxID=562 RepID=UPI00358EA998